MSSFARVCLGVLVAALIALLLWPDQSAPPSEAAAESPRPSTVTRSPARTIELAPVEDEQPVRTDAQLETRAARDRLRTQILAAEQARVAAAPHPSRPAPSERPEASTSSEIRDRIGGHEALVARLNEDFMPLADECIEAALERDPSLGGMLAVGVEIITDEDLGSIVEGVEFPARNEVEDEELQTCIRETTLSMILPKADSGREQLLLTLNVESPPP